MKFYHFSSIWHETISQCWNGTLALFKQPSLFRIWPFLIPNRLIAICHRGISETFYLFPGLDDTSFLRGPCSSLVWQYCPSPFNVRPRGKFLSVYFIIIIFFVIRCNCAWALIFVLTHLPATGCGVVVCNSRIIPLLDWGKVRREAEKIWRSNDL